MREREPEGRGIFVQGPTGGTNTDAALAQCNGPNARVWGLGDYLHRAHTVHAPHNVLEQTMWKRSFLGSLVTPCSDTAHTRRRRSPLYHHLIGCR